MIVLGHVLRTSSLPPSFEIGRSKALADDPRPEGDVRIEVEAKMDVFMRSLWG
jgi:hypothetical protein